MIEKMKPIDLLPCKIYTKEQEKESCIICFEEF